MKCAVQACEREAKRWCMCIPHAMTWVLTPKSSGDVAAFVARQDVRNALHDTRPSCRNGCAAKALETGECSACMADSL